MTPADLQGKLNENGFNAGPQDGIMGPQTKAAIDAWFLSGWDLDAPRPATQRISRQGVDFIHGWESCRLTAYKDGGGVWTIGWGHTSAAGAPAVKSGMKITQAEADSIFINDIAKFEERVRDEMGNVPQQVFDGATSFDYNAGAIDAASWPDAWKSGNMADAERRLKLWNKDNGKVVLGLTKRRAAEADMIFRGNYTGRP